VGASAIYTLIKKDLVPFLLGKEPEYIEKIWQEMWWHLHFVGRGGIASFAMSAVDTALWDLNARLADQPLWRFLGGHSNEVQVYAGGIDLMYSTDQLCEQTQKNLDKGFRAIKMKVGRANVREDRDRIAAVREIVGPGFPLMVDANMGWSVEQAIEASRIFAEFDLFWLEEPVIPDDIEGHARVAREGKLPIATGENLHTLYEFQKMIDHGDISFAQPDVANIGGITTWMKVADLASNHGLPVSSHGVHDLHVHLLAAVPNASFLEVHGFGLEKYIRHPMQIKDGVTHAPERPGHGIEFDWEALKSLLV
jgi:L-alanine-DL-glutamate epimerase-like enolase superfamily enzyme